MEKPAFLENLKEKLISLKDRLFAWCKENKKLAIIIGSLSVVIILCIILLIAFSGKKKNKQEDLSNHLELTQELLVPNGPELPRDYTISRETKENWSQEEAEEWFSVPSDKEIEGLSKANDNLIDEILGAAP